MADSIQYQFTAEVDDLKDGIVEIYDSLSDAFTQMQEQVTQLSDTLSSKLKPSLDEAGHGARETGEEMRGLGDIMEAVHDVMHDAFEVAGLVYAYEKFKQLGEVMERVGERAVHFQALSQILGVTVEQVQAMSLVSDAAGTSLDVFARAGERLITTMQQARDGSSSAVDQLRMLGITVEQIEDPTFNLNDMLAVLRERLEGGRTSQLEMNELIKEFGPRAALAAQAIKEYDGSAAGVQETLKGVNALSGEQVSRLHDMADWWKRLGETIANTSGKLAIAIADMSKMPTADELQNSSPEAQAKAAGDMFGGGDGKPSVAEQADPVIEAQQRVANSHVEISEVITKDDLDQLRERIDAEKAGTDVRLALVRDYYSSVKALYPADNEAVKKAHKELITEEKSNSEQRKHIIEELSSFTTEMETEVTRKKIELQKEQNKLNQDALNQGLVLAREAAKEELDAKVSSVKQQISDVQQARKEGKINPQEEFEETQALLDEELQAQKDYYAQLRTLALGNAQLLQKIDADQAHSQEQYLAEVQKAHAREVDQIKAKWSTLTNSLTSGFNQAFKGILNGTESFGQGLRNIFVSVFNALIDMLLKWVENWIENMLIAKIANKTTAVSQISANAGVAATAAMASVAAIPYVGWAMAPEVGASTAAEALGFESLASAAGGYELPEDMLVYAHKDEKILPASFSKRLDNFLSDPQGGGSSSESHFHGDVNLSALDAPSLRRLLSRPGGRESVVGAAMRHYKRGGR